MYLMLDAMAQRYSCLPSRILAEGDTLDITVMTRAIAWHNVKEERRQKGQAMPNNFGYDTQALQAILEEARR